MKSDVIQYANHCIAVLGAMEEVNLKSIMRQDMLT